MIYPLLVRIPPRVLLACDRTITRPVWEWRMYFLCLCLVICCIVLIHAAAVYNAHQLFYDVNKIEGSFEKIFFFDFHSMFDEQYGVINFKL